MIHAGLIVALACLLLRCSFSAMDVRTNRHPEAKAGAAVAAGAYGLGAFSVWTVL